MGLPLIPICSVNVGKKRQCLDLIVRCNSVHVFAIGQIYHLTHSLLNCRLPHGELGRR